MKTLQLFAIFLSLISDLYGQKKHTKETNIIIRSYYYSLNSVSCGIPYEYSIISLSYLNSLLPDSTYTNIPAITYQITRNGGIIAKDIPDNFKSLSCCILGTSDYSYQNLVDTLLTADSINKAEGLYKKDSYFLEKELKHRKKNSFSYRHETATKIGIYLISFWIADIDYCICDMKNSSLGGKAAYLTHISNIRKLNKVDKRKLKAFFDKIIYNTIDLKLIQSHKQN